MNETPNGWRSWSLVTVALLVCIVVLGFLVVRPITPAIGPVSLTGVGHTNLNGKPVVVFRLDSPQGNPPLQYRIYLTTADTTNYKGRGPVQPGAGVRKEIISPATWGSAGQNKPQKSAFGSSFLNQAPMG
jgi:hypothetical protein